MRAVECRIGKSGVGEDLARIPSPTSIIARGLGTLLPVNWMGAGEP